MKATGKLIPESGMYTLLWKEPEWYSTRLQEGQGPHVVYENMDSDVPTKFNYRGIGHIEAPE